MANSKKIKKQKREEARKRKEATQFFRVAVSATLVLLVLLYFIFQST